MKPNTQTVKKARNEHKTVVAFINNWRDKNDYNPRFLDEYNKKFVAEFNYFLDNSGLSQDTIEFHKIKN